MFSIKYFSQDIPRLSTWRLISLVLLQVFCWFSTAALAGPWGGNEQPLSAQDAFRFKSTPGDHGGLNFSWEIAPGYYLYRDRLQVRSIPDGTSLSLDTPAGDKKDDPNFGSVEVYQTHVEASLASEGKSGSEIEVTWQGCAEAGVCYTPQTQRVKLPSADAGDSDLTSLARRTWSSGSDSQISTILQQQSLFILLPIFFLLGIGMAFTPCVLPMLPIISSIVVGADSSRSRAMGLSLAFVVPMALVYAALGVGAAYMGTGLQGLFQRPAIILGFSLVFVLLALAMFGFYTLQLPAVIRDRLESASPRGGSLLGAATMGVFSALMVGPCMTAPLAGVLLFISQTREMLAGGLLLLALGLGMGVPLIVVGTLGKRLLPKPGSWMTAVKGSFGFGLLAMAIWMAERALPASLVLALWAIWLMILAFSLNHAARDKSILKRIPAQVAGVIVGLWSVAALMGAAAGASDLANPLAIFAGGGKFQEPVAQAASTTMAAAPVKSLSALAQQLQKADAQGRPVVVDVTADWCTACKTLERTVMNEPAVTSALASVIKIKLDVTQSGPDQQALMKAYQLIGPPTFMFFDRGAERRDLRLVGEFDSGSLLHQLSSLTGQ